MRRSTQSVLLSALVFPGAGHFFLKRSLRGAALMCLSMAGLALIVIDMTEKSFAIIDTHLKSQALPDAGTVSTLLAQSATGPDALIVNMATYGVILCWVFGIIDSYRIGKSQDNLNDRAATGK